VDARRRGARFLLLCAALVATGSGAWVAFSGARGGPLRSGAPAPAFELPALTGGNQDLARYRGRVLFVNFWATWCAPCRASMPHLESIHHRYADDGLIVLGLSVDESDPADVRRFAEKLGVRFRIALADEKVLDQYGPIRQIPTTFFINRRGEVVRRTVGYLDAETLDGYVKELFAR
jgi:thiol-disulfide isomerase/thioredoxin